MVVKYPKVTVQLTGMNGNAYFIISRVQQALRGAGVPDQEIDQFTTECESGDYDHLLQTVMKTVNTR